VGQDFQILDDNLGVDGGCSGGEFKWAATKILKKLVFFIGCGKITMFEHSNI